MSVDDKVKYERLPEGKAMDETDFSLRYHFAEMSDERLREYDPSWSDEKLMEWDGDFRNDGNLMLVCCERDIDVAEYRAVLEEHIKFRGLK
jgi:hypothetical protein